MIRRSGFSDRYSAQQKHGAAHQTCLAHLARDTAFALEHGSDNSPLRFKLWFGKAFDLAREIASFKASTIASKKRELEKQLAALFSNGVGRQDATSHVSCRPKSVGRKISF